MLGRTHTIQEGFNGVREDLSLLMAATMRLGTRLDEVLYLLREDADGEEAADDP